MGWRVRVGSLPWKEKNLDYEIETYSELHRHHRPNGLKRKEPRLRDWNNSCIPVMPSRFPSWKEKNLDYEIETYAKRTDWTHTQSLKRKEPRLRDWNLHVQAVHTGWPQCLKRKEPRLRDWNYSQGSWAVLLFISWKEKNLDYEIETVDDTHMLSETTGILKRKEPRLRDWNGLAPIAPFSGLHRLKRKEPRLRDWNCFAADDVRQAVSQLRELEKKRTSITRLKQLRKRDTALPRLTWKEKNLDYEIETCIWRHRHDEVSNLKRKEPRLRDWNRWSAWRCKSIYSRLEKKRTSITRLKPSIHSSNRPSPLPLKRKEPRLRDWNHIGGGCRSPVRAKLEKKRTSITRLKHNFATAPNRDVYAWKEKNLDYEIETMCLQIHGRSYQLEKKRTSITRLKLGRYAIECFRNTETWKEKNLDYEIETTVIQ